MLKTKEEIEKWLKRYYIKKYHINEDLTVDVDGNVSLSHKGLKSIDVQFNIVTGSFFCNNNKLENLVGCPQDVLRHFWCNNNKLKRLKGCPKEIGGDFNCENNELTSLEGSPTKVGEDFDCHNNDLTTLDFLAKEIGGSVNLCRNKNLGKFQIMTDVQEVNRLLKIIERKNDLSELLNNSKIKSKINKVKI